MCARKGSLPSSLSLFNVCLCVRQPIIHDLNIHFHSTEGQPLPAGTVTPTFCNDLADTMNDEGVRHEIVGVRRLSRNRNPSKRASLQSRQPKPKS